MNNPTPDSHTHCQAVQSHRKIHSLSKSVSEPTHGQKEKKYDRTTMYIRCDKKSCGSEAAPDTVKHLIIK
jgi:hypothetical protein